MASTQATPSDLERQIVTQLGPAAVGAILLAFISTLFLPNRAAVAPSAGGGGPAENGDGRSGHGQEGQDAGGGTPLGGAVLD
jgi:hypothetical protein